MAARLTVVVQSVSIMNPAHAYRMKIIADEVVANELRASASHNPSEFQVLSDQAERDATRLGFTIFEAVALVVTVAKVVVDSLKLAAKISEWLAKSRANKIVIQFPGQTLEFTKNSAISREEIQKLLKSALALTDDQYPV